MIAPTTPGAVPAVARELAEHAYLTLVRSCELARERKSEATSTGPPGALCREQLPVSAAGTTAQVRRVGGMAAPIVADASRRRTGLDQAPDP
jgi:hypothetical protein